MKEGELAGMKDKHSFCYVLAVGLTIFAVYLILNKYHMELEKIAKIICYAVGIGMLYTFVHEMLHLMIAKIFSMKRIFVKVFGVIILWEERRIKIWKGKDFKGAGNCFALPTWKNTEIQWIIYIITPWVLTVIGTLILWIIKSYFEIQNLVWDCAFYMGVLYCIWSIFPIKGSDLYYFWMYFLDKERVGMIFHTLKLNYALIFSDINIDEFLKQRKIPENIRMEFLEDYLCAHMKCSILLLLMGKGEISREMEQSYLAFWEKAQAEYQVLFGIYTWLATGENYLANEKWNDRNQGKLSYENVFFQILSGKEKSIDKLLEQFKSVTMKFEAIGIKEPYKLEKELYVAKAKKVIDNE